MAKSKKTSFVPVLSIENLVGAILACLIVFDFKVEQRFANLVKTPIGMLLVAIIFIVMLLTMNPLVAVLFAIYIYDHLRPSPTFNEEVYKEHVMRKMDDAVTTRDTTEVDIIAERAPLVKPVEISLTAPVMPVQDKIAINYSQF